MDEHLYLVFAQRFPSEFFFLRPNSMYCHCNVTISLLYIDMMAPHWSACPAPSCRAALASFKCSVRELVFSWPRPLVSLSTTYASL